MPTRTKLNILHANGKLFARFLAICAIIFCHHAALGKSKNCPTRERTKPVCMKQGLRQPRKQSEPRACTEQARSTLRAGSERVPCLFGTKQHVACKRGADHHVYPIQRRQEHNRCVEKGDREQLAGRVPPRLYRWRGLLTRRRTGERRNHCALHRPERLRAQADAPGVTESAAGRVESAQRGSADSR